MPSTSSRGGKEQRNHTQRLTSFRCHHCPFLGSCKKALENHLHHHNTKFSFRCSFCSYSVRHSSPMVVHINRVHPEETVRYTVLKKKAGKQEAIIIIPAHKPLVERHTQLENQIPAQADETADIVDLTMETEEDEEVMVIEHDPENPWCLLCGKQQSDVNQSQMVNCDQCDNSFHASCVDQQPDAQWFCPVCIHKDSPMRHMSKLIKATNSFSQVYYDGQSSAVSTSIPNSDGTIEELPTSPSTSLPIIPNAAEETRCRNKLEQCAQNIRSCQADIVKASKELKEEERKVRTGKATKYQQLTGRLKKLKVNERELSIELARLREAKKQNQIEENEGSDLKEKIEKEISKLTMSSCGTLKIEAFDSLGPSLGTSSDYLEKTDVRIQRRESNLANVKQKLIAIWNEERALNERIQTTRTKLEENSQNLSDLRQDLEKLWALSGFKPPPSEKSSSIIARIKELKESQRGFIKRFAGLEVRLLKLKMNIIADDIREKEKEWLELYDCGDVEV